MNAQPEAARSAFLKTVALRAVTKYGRPARIATTARRDLKLNPTRVRWAVTFIR